jgi:hypothetical protein
MYDMYPWDSASQGDYPPRPLRSLRNSRKAAKATATARRDISPAQAVQIALDRRDNGGAAEQAAPAPAASQARQ